MIAYVIAAEAAKSEAGGSGFAPFETWHFPSQIFWLVVLFGFLYFMLSRFILPSIGNTLERRESTIAKDLDEAARLNDKAVEAQKATEIAIGHAHAKARDTAAQARAKIEADIAEATAKADAATDQKLVAAETRISELSTEAMKNVEQIAVEATDAMLTKFKATASSDVLSSTVKSVLKG